MVDFRESSRQHVTNEYHVIRRPGSRRPACRRGSVRHPPVRHGLRYLYRDRGLAGEACRVDPTTTSPPGRCRRRPDGRGARRRAAAVDHDPFRPLRWHHQDRRDGAPRRRTADPGMAVWRDPAGSPRRPSHPRAVLSTGRPPSTADRAPASHADSLSGASDPLGLRLRRGSGPRRAASSPQFPTFAACVLCHRVRVWGDPMSSRPPEPRSEGDIAAAPVIRRTGADACP